MVASAALDMGSDIVNEVLGFDFCPLLWHFDGFGKRVFNVGGKGGV